MNRLIEESWSIWQAGGFLMIPLALLAFGLFYAETRLLFQLRRHSPTLPEGIQSGSRRISRIFETAREQVLKPVDRRIRYYGILVGVCPLLGLLGTVAGMTTTFTGMAQPGVSNLSFEVAGGVSEALVTTQAGLLVAIPGMILLAFLKRGRDRIALRYFTMETELLEGRTRQLPPIPGPTFSNPKPSES